jgi:hypothetical protein
VAHYFRDDRVINERSGTGVAHVLRFMIGLAYICRGGIRAVLSPVNLPGGAIWGVMK